MTDRRRYQRKGHVEELMFGRRKNHCGVENFLDDESIWTNCIKGTRNRRRYLPVW